MEAGQSESFYQIVKQQINEILANFNMSSSDVITYVSYFGIAFLCGLFLRRYGKWFVAIVVGSTLILAAFQYFNLITVHHGTIKELLGLQAVSGFDGIIDIISLKIKESWVNICISIIGIIVGFKLG